MLRMKKLTTLVLSATLATTIFSSVFSGNTQTVLADTQIAETKAPVKFNLAVPVKNSLDDIEERPDGTLDYDSSDLEITWESPTSEDHKDQLLGIRFADLSIPKGAKIENAYIQFSVDEPDKSYNPFDVTIKAEDTADSAAFENVNKTVSSRVTTTESVEWKDAPMWTVTHEAGAAQQTPNLASLVQKIIDKDGWSSGKAISFIMNGSGNRTAESFDGAGQASEIPTLYIDYTVTANENQVPKQLNVHIGDDASSSVNLTYTTIEDAPSKVTINKAGDSNKIVFEGESNLGMASKYIHGISVTGLEANTHYEYTVGEGLNTATGKFKTAPAKGSRDSFKFVYLADPQVANATDAKALGATFQKVSEMKDLDFVYLAGDITNTATSETQWELLFNNGGAFANGGQNMFSTHSISVIQGNHDNNEMFRHINAPAQEGNIVYSYDYGPAKFIMLNLETAKSDPEARERQKAFVEQKVAEAKAAGQWTIVNFHKSIYTGASHVDDADVIAARKYWGPVFADLDVDMVLQGHDHVYSRGFVTKEGQKAEVVKNADGSVEDPRNSPLYMVGGHAGGLKWYSSVNYTVTPGDPLAPNYSFLDVNSIKDQSNVKKEQWILEMEVADNEFTLNTYTFKYDTTTDTITKEKELVDTLHVKRNVASAGITGSNIGVADTNQEVTYTTSLKDVKDTNAFNMEVEYDSNVMEFVKAESLLDGTIFSDTKNENGKASIVVGTQNPITNANSIDVAKFTFKMKETAEAGATNVKLTKADSAQAVIEDGKVIGAFDTIPVYDSDKVETEIYTYTKAADINGDGKVTLADLSIALGNYQGTEKNCDVDLDGIVNAKDFIIVSDKLAL